MLCGQVGIAGSVTLGDYVTLGGRVSIRDHVCIASKVKLATNSCVTKNITEAGDYGGFPTVPIHEWRKQVVSIRQTSKEFWYNTQMKSCDEILILLLVPFLFQFGLIYVDSPYAIMRGFLKMLQALKEDFEIFFNKGLLGVLVLLNFLLRQIK